MQRGAPGSQSAVKAHFTRLKTRANIPETPNSIANAQSGTWMFWAAGAAVLFLYAYGRK